jgi:hypothetical protein
MKIEQALPLKLTRRSSPHMAHVLSMERAAVLEFLLKLKTRKNTRRSSPKMAHVHSMERAAVLELLLKLKTRKITRRSSPHMAHVLSMERAAVLEFSLKDKSLAGKANPTKTALVRRARQSNLNKKKNTTLLRLPSIMITTIMVSTTIPPKCTIMV